MLKGIDTNRQANQALNVNEDWLNHVQMMDIYNSQNNNINTNRKWLQQIQRMDKNRIPKQAIQHRIKMPKTCRKNGHRLTKQALKYKQKVT